jgi:hypothetical protein
MTMKIKSVLLLALVVGLSLIGNVPTASSAVEQGCDYSGFDCYNRECTYFAWCTGLAWSWVGECEMVCFVWENGWPLCNGDWAYGGYANCGEGPV